MVLLLCPGLGFRSGFDRRPSGPHRLDADLDKLMVVSQQSRRNRLQTNVWKFPGRKTVRAPKLGLAFPTESFVPEIQPLVKVKIGGSPNTLLGSIGNALVRQMLPRRRPPRIKRPSM